MRCGCPYGRVFERRATKGTNCERSKWRVFERLARSFSRSENGILQGRQKSIDSQNAPAGVRTVGRVGRWSGGTSVGCSVAPSPHRATQFRFRFFFFFFPNQKSQFMPCGCPCRCSNSRSGGTSVECSGCSATPSLPPTLPPSHRAAQFRPILSGAQKSIFASHRVVAPTG